MAIVTPTLLKEFTKICNTNGINCDPFTTPCLLTLLDFFAERKNGHAYSILERLEDDYPTSDLAKMLLSMKSRDDIEVNGTIYDSPKTLSILRTSLVEALQQRVFRYGKGLVLTRGYGNGGGEAVSLLIKTDAEGPEDDFFLDELTTIIKADEGLKKKSESLRGNKIAGEYTKNPDIRGIILWMLEELDGWAQSLGLTKTQEFGFIYDTLDTLGFIPEKKRSEMEAASATDKYQFIQNLLQK